MDRINLICNPVLPTRTMRSIWRTMRRICMLIMGLKGLNTLRTPRGRNQVIFLTLSLPKVPEIKFKMNTKFDFGKY